MNYTKYDKNTGKIIGNLFISSKYDLDKNISSTEDYLDGSFSDQEYYVDALNKIPIKYPIKPEGFYTFDYSSKTWVADVSQQWNQVRRQRNELLQSSDWTQLPDVPLSTKETWAIYRQALRDVTSQPDPFNITWPQPPN
jgi:uncharacterized protein YjiS (DUF1127 family)